MRFITGYGLSCLCFIGNVKIKIFFVRKYFDKFLSPYSLIVIYYSYGRFDNRIGTLTDY